MTEAPLPRALATIVDDIERSRARVLRLIDDVSQRGADWRATPTTWSIGQVIDHLIRAEVVSARVIAGMAKRATADSPPYPAALSEFTWRPPTTNEKWDVMIPDVAVQPAIGRPISALRMELGAQGVRTRHALERLATFDPRCITVPHPLIDVPLNLAQWGCFIAYHLRVHARQIDEIRAARPADMT